MDRICDFSFQIRNCSYRNIQPHHIVHLNISYLKYWLYIALILNKGCNKDYTYVEFITKTNSMFGTLQDTYVNVYELK